MEIEAEGRDKQQPPWVVNIKTNEGIFMETRTMTKKTTKNGLKSLGTNKKALRTNDPEDKMKVQRIAQRSRVLQPNSLAAANTLSNKAQVNN